MKRLVLSAGLFMALCGLVAVTPPALVGAEADSLGAKATREKKLPLKLKVDWDNVMLRQVFEEIPSLVQSGGGGTLRIRSDPRAVTLTSRITIKGEFTLEEICKKICEPKSWGWYVISTKVGDQNDGALMFTDNSKEQGYKEGTGPMAKGSDPKKSDPKKEDPKEKMKEEPKKDVDAERAASDALSKAKLMLNLKQEEKAKKALTELVTKFPDTKAATEAKKLLDKLPK